MLIIFARLLAVWLLGILSAHGAAVAGDYLVDVWTSEEGLPDSSVTALAQTPDGYLWIGTYNGLVRFDGVRFVAFDPVNTPALGHARVQALSVDNRGTLWVNTFDGSLTSLKQGTFGREWSGTGGPNPDVITLVSSISNQVTFRSSGGVLRRKAQADPAGEGWTNLALAKPGGFSLCVGDCGGTLWNLDAEEHLVRLSGGIFAPQPPDSGLDGVRVTSLVTDAAGQLWVATDKGVARWNGSQFKTLTPTNAPWPGGVTLISMETDGDWWGAVDGHLRHVRQRQWAQEAEVNQISLTGYLPCVGLQQDHHGGEWLYGYGLGLSHISANGQVRKFRPEAGLIGERVSCFLEDREGNWWAGLDPGGLVRISERRFKTMDTDRLASAKPAKSICQETNGTLWVGTLGDGLTGWRAGVATNLTVPGGTDKGFAFCVCSDACGRLWVSAGEQDLFVRDQGEFKRIQPVIHGVKVILADPSRGIWVGTKIGLYFTSGDAAIHFKSYAGLGQHDVRALAPDGKGGLWVGAGDGMLFHLVGQTISAFHPTDNPVPQAIWSLFAETNGTVWAGTFRGGLLRFRDGKFTRFGLPEGLPDNIICQILPDDAGNLWVGSHQGVFRVAISAMENFMQGIIKFVPCMVYGRSDGLPSLECSGGFQPAACRDRDGRLWFTTVKGAVSVKPEEIRPNLLMPPVVIEEILINGSSLMATAKSPVPPATNGAVYDRAKKLVEVPPGKRQIEFRYTGLSLVSSDRMRFRYRLEGVDTDWVEAGVQRTVQYNLLRAGTYRFIVTAANSDNVWNNTGDALTLIIQPYFYETLWFRLLAGLVAAGLVAGAVWYSATRRLHRKLEQLGRQQALERERARIAKDIHDDLGANLTLIARLGHLARQEKTIERIEKMESTARQAVKSLDEIVWAVNPRNDTLAHLIDYSGQFATDYLYAAGISCLLDVPEQTPRREVPSNVRHNVFLVIKEALQNIVKHAQATEVWLRIHVSSQELRMVIEDNGRGFDRMPEDALADGLRNMQQRMNELGGQCLIQSRAGHGTKIIIVTPWARE